MDATLKNLLNNYLERIEDETNGTLEAIKEYFQQSKRKFNGQFREFFLGKANKRIAKNFDQFVALLQYEEYLLGIDANNEKIGEPSIKQEIDDVPNFKAERLEEEFGDENHSFTVWNPLTSVDDQEISSDLAANSSNREDSIAQSHIQSTNQRKMQKNPSATTKLKSKQRKRVEKSVNLNRHTRKHTSEKPFECEICFKGFAHKHNLKKHMRTHANEFPFKCSICRVGFTLEMEWKTHENNCNRKRFECDLCEYVTLNKMNMVNHMRIHNGEKPFQCKICAKRFTQKQHLKSHMRIHANQFPFQCSKCRQGFSHRNQWESHEVNCNQRRHECYLCEYKSLHKSHLTDHMRLHHTGVKPFQCSKCQKRFTWKNHLDYHSKNFHFHSENN